MIDPELLSRFVDGDVTPDEAAQVEAAMRADPAVASRVASLRGVVDGLRALRDPEPPVRLLVHTAPPRRAGWSLGVAGGVGALVAAAGWLLVPVPTLVLAPGEHRLVGRVEAAVGDVSVDVDGDVSLAWEPEAAVVRVTPPEVEMDRGHVGAAVLGGMLTVGVLGGSATVCGGDGVEVVVPAGGTRTVAVGAAGTQPRATDEADEVPASIAAEDAAADTVARLRERVASLEAELSDARRQAGLAQGQLTLEQGTPIAWPAELDADLTPTGFDAAVHALVKQRGDLAVETIDCAEYPCVAVLRPTSVEGDWPERYRGVGEALSAGVARPDASMSVSRIQEDDGTERGYVAVWVSDQDAPVDGGEVDRRAGWRARALVEGVVGTR